MDILLLSCLILMGSAVAALVLSRWEKLAAATGCLGAASACGLGLAFAVKHLLEGSTHSLQFPWSVPFGSFCIGIDPLTSFFLIPVFLLCGLSAWYGHGYLKSYSGKKNLAVPWFFLNLLILSMVFVVISRNAVLFLMAWELMSLASFFLVCFEDEHETVRQAGRTYLIATHLGVMFLFVLFILLGQKSGNLDFSSFFGNETQPASFKNILFFLALIGFGTKAGFLPIHVWLPEAHPAAPSFVSAIMSGVMVKTGIYGLLRILTFIGSFPVWWGIVLVGLGICSGLYGVLMALSQQDIKRMLAYSTVENIGIITIGLGMGLMGMSLENPALLVFGFAGALLHCINHSIFKGLLFLNAGAVLHATGTREIDQLGGLLKTMPKTGFGFAVGSMAICALPPFNGFIGEFLIYVGAFQGGVTIQNSNSIVLFILLGGMALIGGLVAALFCKAFGFIFLGEPRSEKAAHPHSTGFSMNVPPLILAALCLLMGVFSPYVFLCLKPVFSVFPAASTYLVNPAIESAAAMLSSISLIFALVLIIPVALAFIRYRLLSSRAVDQTGTWDCGYAAPTSRMEYTGSSFSQPLVDLFSLVLFTKKVYSGILDFFPTSASFKTKTPDWIFQGLFVNLFMGTNWFLSKLRWLQHGRVQIYVLYIALTLLILLLFI